jgi:hypothetical protein
MRSLRMRSLIMVCLMAVLLVGMSLESRADIINGYFSQGFASSGEAGWFADQTTGEEVDDTSYVKIEEGQAVLSTPGVASNVDMISLWQWFEVPKLATTISFDVFFSNTPDSECSDDTDDSFPNYFQASYVDDNLDEYYAFFMGVDENGFYAEGFNLLLTPSPLVALENNWFRYTTSITNLVGRSGTLYFDLLDMDEDCYSTAKIDNVTITSAPVPEPSTLLLMGCGFVGLAGVFRKKIKKGLKAV